MKRPTRRKLFWIGAILIAIPTVLLIITAFQAREYQSTIFIEVGKPGVIHNVPEEPTVLYFVLLLLGVYLPGFCVLLVAFLSRSRQPSVSESPQI